MLELNNRPMIYWQIQRILQSELIENLLVATSADSTDDVLADFLAEHKVAVFRGSLTDVHSRFLAVVKSNPTVDTFVRLTADCPLVMPDLLTDMLNTFSESNFDYFSNCINPTYPDGLDIEIFSRDAFMQMSDGELSDLEKEHVTLKFRSPSQSFQIGEKHHSVDLSNMRWTVDYKEDLEFVRNVFGKFVGQESTFSLQDVLSLLESHPELNTQLPATLRNIRLQERGKDAI